MTEPAAVAETHSAVVFFMGDHAFKVKKPVDLGFLDFRSRAAREAVCLREVELNRRLAPDVYEGVADIVGPDGQVCDHLVVMRRMPASRRLSSLVRGATSVDHAVVDIARQLTVLHERSPRSEAADRAAGIDATRHRWEVNTEQLIEMGPVPFDDVVVGLVHGLACRYLDGRSALFEDRVASGRAVDGHGDLLADDIFCLDDGPRILDCIEFDDDLRLGDGLADAAFLAMDLERLGRRDLADLFLRAYGELRGDVWPTSLAHHQIAYRAQVRAKVTAMRALQGDPGAGTLAVSLLDLALTHLRRGRVELILVGGLPGTGKSTLANGVAEHLGGVLLHSDDIRKELAGIPASQHDDTPYTEGIYTPEWTTATYTRLLDRAQAALRMGDSVVLDASWIDPAQRQRARRIGEAAFADVVQLRCEASSELAAARLLARRADAADASDATPAIAAAMAADAAPWPQATMIDTSEDVDTVLASALAHV